MPGIPEAASDERARRAVLACRERPAGVREQSLRPQHVVGEQLTGGSQRRLPPPADDELLAELGFERRDVLRHRRLADVELLRRTGERPLPRDGREGAQTCLDIHSF